MKSIMYTKSVSLLLLLFIFSCNNDDSTMQHQEDDTNPINTQPPLEEGDLYNLSLDIQKIDIPNEITVNPQNLSIGFDGSELYITSIKNNMKFLTAFNVNNGTSTNLQMYNDNNFLNNRLHYYKNDYIPAIIGYDNQNLYKFNLAFQVWTINAVPQAILPKVNGKGTAMLKDKLFFMGGDTDDTNFVTYNMVTNEWQEATGYYHIEGKADMVAINDKLYCFANDERGVFYVFDYNGSLQKSSNYSFKTRKRGKHSVTAFQDRYIFTLTENHDNDAIYIYDTAKPSWRGIPISVELDKYTTHIFSDENYVYLVGKDSNENKLSIYKITVNK